jgi:hydroxymethylpyrimidine pyrophosphatase-like HAD family hydrolase
MVLAAGLGVAMQNSMPELLEQADRVIGDNEGAAIAGLIEELFLG